MPALLSKAAHPPHKTNKNAQLSTQAKPYPIRKAVWLYLSLFWIVIALLNFANRKTVVFEDSQQGIYSMLTLIFINIFMSAVTLIVLQRLNIWELGLKLICFSIITVSIIIGLISAVMVVASLGVYFLYFDELHYFVFFWNDVQGNWLLMSVLHFTWLALYLSSYHYQKLQKIQQKNTQLNLEHKESQLNTLIGQINPHFLFNGLNNIRSLMLEDVSRSREMITHLSELLRYSLLSNEVPFRTIEEELEIVDNYIALAKIQYEERLEYRQQIDSSLYKHPIPTMLIQLMVENAVRHGIDHCTATGVLSLTVETIQPQDSSTVDLATNKSSINHEGPFLLITTKNPGQLQASNYPSSTGIGIKNIQSRLQLLYEGQAQFYISQQQQTVTACCLIPFNQDLPQHSQGTGL